VRLLRHQHSDFTVKVDIPTEDVEDLIDKATESVITIIAVATAAHILRKWVTR
jgi:hypothetical protein